jgi:hypothetical protein
VQTPPFNLAKRIQQVRALDASVTQMTQEFEKQIKPAKDLINSLRGQILEHLNATGQKSASTEFGGAHWKAKITYQVENREEFQRHVIGAEEWELIGWSAAPNACEAYLEAHKASPPGLKRNSVNILYVTAPPKVNVRKPKDAPEDDEAPQSAAE